MPEKSEREVLHHLIEICSDGALGFRMAAAEVRDPDLRALFAELADERSRFAADLIPYLRRMDGTTDTDGASKAAVHRGWMTFQSLAPGNRDHAIVIEAERGERAALNAYDRALTGLLPLTVDWLVEAQREAVRKAHERILAFGAQL